MASIPGARFDITGASGSQGLLTPKSGWRAYVLPRGGYAAQDSTGTLITFDSAAVASRFAANDWIQSGLLTANIRLVAAVGGNSLSVSGAALTVTENDRIYLIGTTEPTVTGGSATYTTPNTRIRQRDDDGADLYTNSMVTSNSNGLIQFFGAPNYYDVIVQDGNRANQGSIIDLPLGAVDGISTSVDALFGASLTVNGALGITGWATFGSTVTMNAALGVTGWATFGSTVTMNSTLGVTGVATLSGRVAFGHSVSIDGALGVTGIATLVGGVTGGITVTGAAIFGNTVTVNGALGITGSATFGSTVTLGSTVTISGAYLRFNRLGLGTGTALTTGNFSLTAGWGTSATVTLPVGGNVFDTYGFITVNSSGTGQSANPSVTLTFSNGTYGGVPGPVCLVSRGGGSQRSVPFTVSTTPTTAVFRFEGTPVDTETYTFSWLVIDQT